MTLEILEKHKIIAIIRGVYGEPLLNVANALFNGGIKLAEVTFEQDELGESKTASAIKGLAKSFGDRLFIGAGTVLTQSQLHTAYEAGAKFIVSPNTNPEIIRATKELGLISIPGAMTPTEIFQAHACGADYIKIFPAGQFGEAFIKSIKAPFPHMKFVATAGVTEENIVSFISAGYSAVGISERLVDKTLIAENDFEGITKRAKQFVELIK